MRNLNIVYGEKLNLIKLDFIIKYQKKIETIKVFNEFKLIAIFREINKFKKDVSKPKPPKDRKYKQG